jgi:predicted small metal-binding protein
MMKLTCKDMDPTTTCAFEATGETATEVAGKMMAHAKTAHADHVAGMSDADMMTAMEAKVHS